MFNSSITLLKFGGIIGASILGLVAASELSDAYKAAKEEAVQDIANDRTDSEKEIFRRLSDLKAKVNDILADESRENDALESKIIERMNAAKAKCQFIFDREKAAFDREREELVESYKASKTIKDGVLAREKELLTERLRSDKKYQAFETSKRAFQASGMPTSEMEEAMAKRKKDILAEIIEARSDVEKTAFAETDTLTSRLNEFDRTRMGELRKERTPEESAIVHEFDSIKGDLANKSQRMKDIASRRTPEQEELFESLKSTEAQSKDILDKEKAGVDGTKAFARYLGKRKIPKWAVLAFGLIPMIPVVYISYRYLKWLLNFTKMMEV